MSKPVTWVVADGTDSIDNMAYCLMQARGTDDEWVSVGLEDADGYAESVAYTHPSNARLIAAAPQMYEALRVVAEFLHDAGKLDTEACKLAMAALLAARGGAS